MLRVKPYGLLGYQLTVDGKEIPRGRSPCELESCCIVDPSGLLGSGGPAGAVYRWLGISQNRAFAPEVADNLTSAGDAKFYLYSRYRYGVADKHVIHSGAGLPVVLHLSEPPR